MYTSALIKDCWNGVRNQEITIKNPSFSDIKEAVKCLDGNKYTMITLQGNEDAHMVIGGGKDGQYIAYVTFDNIEFFNIISKDGFNKTITLFIGGQEGEYPENTVIDSTLVLKAAQTFAEYGKLDSEVNWANE